MHYCGVLPLPLVLLILSLTAPPKSTRRSCKQWLPYGPHAAVVRTMNGRTYQHADFHKGIIQQQMQGRFSKCRKERQQAFLKLMPDVSFPSHRGGGDASSNLDHELEAMMLCAGEDNADDDGASDLES